MSYLKKLVELGAVAYENGIWACVGHASGDFGWKIHISAIQNNADMLLDKIVPRLLSINFPFKVAKDESVLAELNEGAFGATQIGKFLTIYPSTHHECYSFCTELVSLTQGVEGPTVISDLHIGSAVYVRYGSFAPNYIRNRLGQMKIDDPLNLSQYQVPFRPPESVPNPFSSVVLPASENKNKKKLHGSRFLLLETLSIHPKGIVYSGLDVQTQHQIKLVVVKTGRKYCMSDQYGRHIWDRLEYQFEIANSLPSTLNIPKPIALFDEGENKYLVLEMIKGRDFNERRSDRYDLISIEEKKQIIYDFIALADTVRNMHQAGVVHRDLSPRNIRVRLDGQVFLLDLEMSYDFKKSTVPFQSGTPGFISPQQKSGDIPSTSDDIFSLGCLLVNAITGYDPRRIDLNNQSYLFDILYRLSGAPYDLINLCTDMLSFDPSTRPSIANIISRFQCISDSLTTYSRIDIATVDRSCILPTDKVLIRNGLKWLCTNGFRDSAFDLPLSLEVEATHDEAAHSKSQSYRLYRSASRGIAGLIYTIAQLKQLNIQDAKANTLANVATDWLLDHHPTPDDQMPGLHYGEAGVAVALSEAVSANVIDSGDWFLPYLYEALDGPLDWPDLTHGAAGQGLAAMICSTRLNLPDLLRFSDRCATYLIETQASNGSWVLPSDGGIEDNIDYTGYAHGTAGIVSFLIRYASLSKCEAARTSALRGADWLESKMFLKTETTIPIWPLQSNSDASASWHWWCHGGPGIAMTFLHLFTVTKKEHYADIARQALQVHPKRLLGTNLSQCHGLAGLGEIYLEAEQILGDSEWRSRANHIKSILEAFAHHKDGTASWLVENAFSPTADLMIGNSGVLHFLARMQDSPSVNLGLPLEYYA